LGPPTYVTIKNCYHTSLRTPAAHEWVKRQVVNGLMGQTSVGCSHRICKLQPKILHEQVPNPMQFWRCELLCTYVKCRFIHAFTQNTHI